MKYVNKARKRVSTMRPLTLVALAALAILVVGGSATAATLITSSDIENGTVKSKDLKNGRGVRGIDVRNNSLTGKDIRGLGSGDFKPSERDELQGPAGPQGPQGPAGPTGLTGATGAAGADGNPNALYISDYLADGEERSLAVGGPLRIFATCDIQPTGGNDVVEISASTSEDDSAIDDNDGPEDSDWDVLDGDKLLNSASSDDTPDIEVTGNGGGGAGATATAADGSVIAFNAYAMGVNLGGFPDLCFVSGLATSTSAS